MPAGRRPAAHIAEGVDHMRGPVIADQAALCTPIAYSSAAGNDHVLLVRVIFR